jgi:tol-pal system protein YbgF
MVIYSAGINEQALDRLSRTDKDPNGLFTREFLKYLRQPGLRVDEMLKQVRGAVRTQAAAVGHAQNPAIYDQSSGDFYFLREDTEARPSAPAPPPPLATERHDDAVEIAFWNSVKDAKTPAVFHAYLQQYPQGKFAILARLKLQELPEPSKPGSTMEAVSSSSATSVDDQLYKRALKDYQEKNYEAAVVNFKQYLKQAPKSPLAGNAQYLIGESLYAQKQYEAAIVAFDEVVQKHSQDPKVAAAMLKQGYAFAELKATPKAQFFLREVQEKYPGSPEAQQAAEKMKALPLVRGMSK